MPAWGEDDLSKFLDVVHTNQQAHRVEFAPGYAVLSRINACFVKAGTNLVNPKPLLVATMLLRSQYALKAAAGMALSGQVVETFTMMRSALEYAGYGLLIFESPPLQDVFLGRHVDAVQMKAQKEAFKISAVKEVISRFDTKLATVFDRLYQRTIDFGGHPNPHAMFSTTTMSDKGDGITGVMTVALSTDERALAHAMKSTAQVGLTALCIFQHAFKEKFELLGIRGEIDALKQAGV